MPVVTQKTLKHQMDTPVTTCGGWQQSTSLRIYMICLRRGDGTPSSGGLSKTEMDCARTSTSESHGFNRGSVNITAISNARILKFTMLRFLFSPPEIQSIVHCTTLNLLTVIFFHRDSSQPNSLSLFIKKNDLMRDRFLVSNLVRRVSLSVRRRRASL